MLCLKADMLKLMATIFKKDLPQVEFFKKTLKFELDETSFVDTVNEQFEYEILCRWMWRERIWISSVLRFNQIKKKKMEEEMGGEKASHHGHGHSHSTAGCCWSLSDEQSGRHFHSTLDYSWKEDLSSLAPNWRDDYNLLSAHRLTSLLQELVLWPIGILMISTWWNFQTDIAALTSCQIYNL